MLERYYNLNETTGLSMTLQADGNAVMQACAVVVNGERLTIVKKLASVAGLESVPAKLPVALNLSGKGVLQKQIERTEEINQNNFSLVLPNAEMSDFYVQNFISGGCSFVSVIRKTEADKWITLLREKGLDPVMLSLGPFPVLHVLPQLNFYNSEVIFNGNVIRRNEQGEWTSVRFDASVLSPFPLKAESESIDEKLVVAYAAAFQLALADKLDPVQAGVPPLARALEKLVADRKLKIYGVAALGVFFILLLINFLLFSWLNGANAGLTEQVSRFAQSSEDMQKVNEQVQQKQTLLKTLGWEGVINKSALIDQVAALLPPEVTWGEAAVDPVDQSGSRAQKFIVFADRRLRITGDAGKIIPVNEWIARVKTKPWVKNIQLESYTFNNELNTGQFVISIDY